MAKTLFSLLILIACFPVLAVEVEHDDVYYEKHPCEALGSFAATECAASKLDKSDEKLKIEYNRLLKKLPTRTLTKKDLIDAQKAWLKYRDVDCEFRVGTQGVLSAFQTVYILDCQAELNEERIKMLKELNLL